MSEAGPWPPAEATRRINAYARDERCELMWTAHARRRMAERDIIMGDVLHVLRFGYVYDPAEPATQPGMFKYLVEGQTPSSGSRRLGVVVVPAPSGYPALKIVTVMWCDETGGRQP